MSGFSNARRHSARGRRNGLAPAIAVRYLWGGRNRYARFIAWVSLVGLALGVLVLSVVVSVMNGLGEELRSRILGTVPHALVTPAAPGLAESLGSLEGVSGAYPFFSSAGMVAGSGSVVPVTLFGMEPADGRLLPRVDDNMSAGTLTDALMQPAAIVMGAPIARHLGLAPGEPVALVVSEPAGGSIHPKIKRFRLAATFAIGAELDHYLVLTRRDAFSGRERRQLGTDGVRVVLAEPMRVEVFADELRRREPTLSVETWKENYGELFQAVRIEKALMFLLLLLVVAVAGFNIVSGQTVLVSDKRGDIAILRTMGADGRFIARVFLLQAVAIASVGIAAGIALGALVAENIGYLVGMVESWLGFRMLEGSYFDVLPSLVLAGDLLVIAALSWLLCLVAAWIPGPPGGASEPGGGPARLSWPRGPPPASRAAFLPAADHVETP